MSDQSEEKTENASKRKLRKQREMGSLPRTADLGAMMNLGVGMLVLLFTATYIMDQVSEMFDTVIASLSLPWDFGRNLAFVAIGQAIFAMTIGIVGTTLAALLLVSMLYHGGLPFSFTPLVPDFTRLNPATGFTRMFGRRSFVEVLIQLIRLFFWLISFGVITWTLWPLIFSVDLCAQHCALDVVKAFVFRTLPVALGIIILFAGIEMMVQMGLYLHEQKMSKSDVKRENKEQHGAPELRSERNRLRKELAAEAENADPTLANMCFYFGDMAVGVRYHPHLAPIPRVAAKAKGPEALPLRRFITDRGYPALMNEKIVKHCSGIAPGSKINKEIYEDLAMAMVKMFGGKRPVYKSPAEIAAEEAKRAAEEQASKTK